MSDFDAVLERLLGDPGFTAALASDPARALAGYRLSADEVELLRSQVSLGDDGERRVEQRTSKASLFGLLSPLAGAAGLGRAAEHTEEIVSGGHAGFGGPGDAAQHAGFGGPADQGIGAPVGPRFGPGGPGGPGGYDGLGGQGLGGYAETGWSDAPVVGDQVDPFAEPTGSGGIVGTNIGDTLDNAVHGGLGAPENYHPHVDVDGDGHWDQYTVRARAGGGVDVVADMNHDGRADFVGHDTNRDGIIDSADYDEDRDGRFETHMRDLDGDGWMDTRGVDPAPGNATGPSSAGEAGLGTATR
jgi:hypothetical protein